MMLRTVSLSARFSAARAYSWPQRELRLLRGTKIAIVFVIAGMLVFSLISFSSRDAALAQAATPSSQRAALARQQASQKKHNDGSLMVLGGSPGTTYFNIVHDMAAAVMGNGDLRLIAVDAPGGIESLRDLLFLRGIDLALVPENVLNYADATASFGPGLRERLNYITELYGEEVHFLVGPDVYSVENLRGKKVAVPPEDGNAEFTTREVLRRLRIEAEIVRVAAADAIDDVRSGAVAALVLMGGKPLRLVAGLPKDGSIRLLAVPFTRALGDDYSPSSFRADDYPMLIPEGQTIDTISVNAVLVTNNAAKSDESTQRVARFVPALFSTLLELGGPQRHPKWSEVNLAATLAGWQRFPIAKELLEKTLREQTASMQKDFEQFLRVNSPRGAPARSSEERRRLFEEYLKWTRASTGGPK